MNLAVVIGVSMVAGMALAEVWHRYRTRLDFYERRRAELIAEFVDKQLWQFISLDEWLNGMYRGHR